MSEYRFIFGTNTIVSAPLFQQSVPRQAFNKARSTGELLLSPTTLTELSDVLKRSKFDKYVLEEERLLFLAALIRESRFVELDEPIALSRDVTDNKFLELAVSGDATCIITGDKDLLVLHPFRETNIFTPRQFLDWNFT